MLFSISLCLLLSHWFLIGLNNLLYFGELDKLVYWLVSNLCLVRDILVIGHLVHVVWAHWPDDVLLLLVVPHLCVLIQLVFVQLVKQGEWSRSVDFLFLFWGLNLFLYFFGLLFLFDFFAQNYVLVACALLLLLMLFVFLVFLVHLLILALNEDLIGIVKSVLQVLRFLSLLNDQTLKLVDWSQPLEFSHWDLRESLDQIVECDFLHN